MPRNYITRPLADRFWEKVDKRSPNECWNWVAAREHFGYGRVRFAHTHLLAHRVSWELTFGLIPHGQFVLHRCDNPSCVNPAHLFLGSTADNVTDRNRKNRQARQKGEKNGGSKLTIAQIQEIRARHAQGNITVLALAKEFR